MVKDLIDGGKTAHPDYMWFALQTRYRGVVANED